MNQDKRLDRVAGSLTPKQAVVVWLQEMQKFRDIFELITYLRDMPASSRPINRLSRQIDDAIRKEMRGQSQAAIDSAVRRGVRDLAFLFGLQHQVNSSAITKQRGWDLLQALLAERLGSMVKERIHLGALADASWEVDLMTPYPLDPETNAAVEAVIANHVTTWEYLEENGFLNDWLFQHLVEKGATQLTGDMYQYREGKCLPNVTEVNQKAVRACFKSEETFELFRSGKDYTNGLTDVSDEEYNRHYDRLVSGARKLVEARVKGGAVVSLETVPVPLLRDAPLVQGERLDRYVVELAEWGGLLQAKGYRFEEALERNALALVPVVTSEGKQVDTAEVGAVRKQACAHLAKFPGKVKQIGGRPYLRFEDYRSWKGRKAKGGLKVQRGFLTASWNALDDDEATVAGVLLQELDHGLGWRRWVPASGLEEELRSRRQMVEGLREWGKKEGKDAELAEDWRQAAEHHLEELLAFREAVAQIGKRYVDGVPLMFPDVALDLGKVIEGMESLVGMFNDLLVKHGLAAPIDLGAIRNAGLKQAAGQMAYLVDMAKAEALDEMGDREASQEMVGRYL